MAYSFLSGFVEVFQQPDKPPTCKSHGPSSLSSCRNKRPAKNNVQSNLVISKSKGPSKTLRDIRTSTYQICSIEEKTIRTTKFHKWLCNLTPLFKNIH